MEEQVTYETIIVKHIEKNISQRKIMIYDNCKICRFVLKTMCSTFCVRNCSNVGRYVRMIALDTRPATTVEGTGLK